MSPLEPELCIHHTQVLASALILLCLSSLSTKGVPNSNVYEQGYNELTYAKT